MFDGNYNNYILDLVSRKMFIIQFHCHGSWAYLQLLIV